MTVNYVICAAGEGSRFRRVFGDIPKPLIRLRGSTLMEWALRSLPIRDSDGIVLITQARDRVREAMHEDLRRRFPTQSVHWVELPSLTRGQLETVLASEPFLKRDSPLAVYNCDTFFRSETLASLMGDDRAEGIIPCSREPGDCWSFCEIDTRDRVVRIEEKNRISPWATVGLYFFRDTPRFLKRARAAVAGNSRGELYVAPVYQEYIDNGETVLIDRVSTFQPMGTPEQIEKYWGISMDQVRSENRLRES